MKKITLSAVSYLNTVPFIGGIRDFPFSCDVEMILDVPSECARKVIDGEVDLGLVPVAVIPEVRNGEIISDHCIGSDGPVRSVVLAGDVDINSMKRVYLDPESRTSVNLVRILAGEHWGIDPEWVDAYPGFEDRIGDGEGAVIIGDKALRKCSKFRYVYDLSESWNEMTGMPFVFAVWLANKKLPDSFKEEFNKALKMGVDSIDGISSDELIEGSGVRLKDYLRDNISYEFDGLKKKSLGVFLKKLEDYRDDRLLNAG
jgi:chorismate dehydratase